jgi:hypothetical protein
MANELISNADKKMRFCKRGGMGVWSNVQDHENEKGTQRDIEGISTSLTFISIRN